MKTLSFSEAKMKLSGLVDLVNSTDEEILIIQNLDPFLGGIDGFSQRLPGHLGVMESVAILRGPAFPQDELVKSRIAPPLAGGDEGEGDK